MGPEARPVLVTPGFEKGRWLYWPSLMSTGKQEACPASLSGAVGVTHLTLSSSTPVSQSPSTGVRPLSLVPVLEWDEVGPLKSQTLASSGEQVLALPCMYFPRFSASNEQLQVPEVVPHLDSTHASS